MAKCTLDERVRQCNEECEKYGRPCGWDEDEQKMRKQLLSKNGLTTCEKGLERLIIKREKSEPNT